MVPSNHLIFCCPLLLLPSVFPSINVFYNVLAVGIRWPKYWSFSFSISPSSEYSEFISFRIDWFDLLAVQGQINEKDPISFMSLTSPYYYSNVLETSCSKNFINPLFVFHDWPGFFFFFLMLFCDSFLPFLLPIWQSMCLAHAFWNILLLFSFLLISLQVITPWPFHDPVAMLFFTILPPITPWLQLLPFSESFSEPLLTPDNLSLSLSFNIFFDVDLALWLLGMGEIIFAQESTLPPHPLLLPASKIKQTLLSIHLVIFISFWEASSQTPLSVTILVP